MNETLEVFFAVFVLSAVTSLLAIRLLMIARVRDVVIIVAGTTLFFGMIIVGGYGVFIGDITMDSFWFLPSRPADCIVLNGETYCKAES